MLENGYQKIEYIYKFKCDNCGKQETLTVVTEDKGETYFKHCNVSVDRSPELPKGWFRIYLTMSKNSSYNGGDENPEYFVCSKKCTKQLAIHKINENTLRLATE